MIQECKKKKFKAGEVSSKLDKQFCFFIKRDLSKVVGFEHIRNWNRSSKHYVFHQIYKKGTIQQIRMDMTKRKKNK